MELPGCGRRMRQSPPAHRSPLWPYLQIILATRRHQRTS